MEDPLRQRSDAAALPIVSSPPKPKSSPKKRPRDWRWQLQNAVRTAAGLFDIDHMGQFDLRGADADAFLQAVQVWDIAGMADYDAHYSLLLYADGTIAELF